MAAASPRSRSRRAITTRDFPIPGSPESRTTCPEPSLTARQRQELTPKIEKLRQPAEKGGGFTGKAPGGPSRWSTERTGEWEPLRPELVVEVEYDHFTGGRFRHGTSFLRWRPDKPPKQCTMDQVTTAAGASLKVLSLAKPARQHLAPQRRS